MVPEEVILVLTDLYRAPTILPSPSSSAQKTQHHHQTTAPTHLRDQNAVARLHRDLHPLALFIESAGAHGEDLGLGQLLDGRLWEEDSRGGLCFSLDALDEDAVEERRKRLDGAEGSGL